MTTIARGQRRENPNQHYDDQIVIVDDIIDVLSSLLEFSGIISNKNDNINNNNNGNGNGNGNNKKDPWDQLSSSIKELIISLGKLHKLVSDEKATAVNITTKVDDTTVTSFETTNELLLFVENIIHQVRVDIESLSTKLPKMISSQLKLCRRLESIIRNNSNNNDDNNNNKRWLSTLMLLLPVAKSLAGAVRQQKAVCLESLQIIGKCLDEELYNNSQEDATTEMIDNLQIMYKKIHRRCIDHNCSPWKEAVGLLEYIASNEIQIQEEPTSSRDDKLDIITRVGTSSDSLDTTCLDPISVNLPNKKACPILLPLSSSSHFDVNSNCASSQLQNIVEDFLYGTTTTSNNDDEGGKRVLSILVFGPEGSGKTFLLNEVEKYYSRRSVTGGGGGGADNIDVIHPVLPFDAIGTTVGAAEEIIISLICYAKTKEGKCILLLDDIDSIFGQTELTTTNEPHQTSRLRQLFFSLLEIIQERNYDTRNDRMILICSSKDNFGSKIDRFDKILPMLPPNEKERRGIISNYHIGEHDEAQRIGCSDTSVENLVECTIGLSRAELSHYCREALIALQSKQESGADTNDFLSFLKQRLQSATPESLKQGVNDDFVDMKVFSARDLQKLYPIRNRENPIADLPLFGESAKAAWRELRRLIVMPVCQGPALDKIMYHRGGRTEKKAFVGGVLLAAAPGTGKSTISYFCAAFASSINHSVKLIDVSCTSLIHKEVGGSERALHRLFQSARSATPCIIVMDGIENIAAVRGNDNTTEGTMDRVLSTLLTELDGVENDASTDNSPGCMTVIGITHNPLWIDPALRRPGRLERTIWLDNPDLEGRKQIVLKELGDVIFKPDQVYPELQKLEDLANQLALETDGYTGAGIIAICNESKLLAFNNFFKDDGGEKRDYITPEIVFEASNSKRPDGR